MVLTSCSKMLNQHYRAAISPDAVTEKDLPAMRNGMYSAMQNKPTVNGFICFDLLGGDITQKNYNSIDMIKGILSPLNAIISGQWNGYYDALYQVNNVIAAAQRFPQSPIAATALGEACYFRAYIYTCLVTRWGAVPIIRKNAMDKVARDPVDDVWAFIDEDLEMADRMLGTSESIYYVSNDAVKALTARVRLYEKRYDEAWSIAESLIGKGTYALDEFENIFNISRPANKETIFAFSNKDIAESSINIGDLYFSYGYVNKGQGKYYPTEDVYNKFSDSDKRKKTTFLLVEGSQCLAKYPSGQAGRDPFIVSRIAEMYLISAEAQGYPAGKARLDELRAKRGLGASAAADQESFIDAILDERQLEFLGENHAWYDCVRTGKAGTRIGLTQTQNLLPIPGKELQLNDRLEPNPGY